MILGLETSCDETAAALVTEAGRDPRERRLLAGRPARALRRRRARGRVAAAPRARRRPSSARRSARRGRRSTTSTRSRSRRARARRRAARRRLGGEGARLGARPAARAGRPPARPRRLALPRARPGRAAVPLPARERRPHAAARRPGPRGLPRPRHVDRRRGRRGVRQGRAAARPRLSRRRARSTGWRARAIPDAFAFPVARLDGLDFSFSGVKTALLYAVRDLGDEAGGAEGRPGRVVPARDRPRARRADARAPPSGRGTSRSRSSAASPRTRSCARRCPDARFAPLALCTDNAAMIASAGRYGRRLPYPRYLELDAYASRA